MASTTSENAGHGVSAVDSPREGSCDGPESRKEKAPNIDVIPENPNYVSGGSDIETGTSHPRLRSWWERYRKPLTLGITIVIWMLCTT